MADDKTFDTEKIVNGESMDALDKLYFEKFGAAMDGQAEIIEENLEEYIRYADETYDSVMENLYNNDGQYLVHGARLKCSKMKKEEGQKLVYKEEELNSEPVVTEDMIDLQVTEERKESDSKLSFANISDTTGGMRGKLLTKGEKLNITSFGNCKFLDEENLEDVEEIAKRVYRAYANGSEFTGITYEMVLNGIIEAIRANMGTCYCCMALNYEWENLPAEYDYVDNTFSTESSGAESYFKFNDKEGINMMSMLFCGFGGGIINAEESGQNRWSEDDNVRQLRNKFMNELEFENWTEQQKKNAELIWNRLYGEKNLDPAFVAAIIGNMCNEGAPGMLQGWGGWAVYFPGYQPYDCIVNVQQAEIACSSSIDAGVGMLQWTSGERKAALLECYKKCTDDGTLSEEQLFEAELNMIYQELHIDGKTSYIDYADIYAECTDYIDKVGNYSRQLEYTTVLFFDSYERPGGYKKEVDVDTHSVKDEMWGSSMEVDESDDIKNICKRVIAANVAYEHFMEKEE